MSHSITLKETNPVRVEATYTPPRENSSRTTEFVLENGDLSLTFFIISLKLTDRIYHLASQIEAESAPLAPNVITVDFKREVTTSAQLEGSAEEASTTISLKEIVRRSMGEMDLNDPQRAVTTIINAMITVFTSGEATTITY